MRQFLLWIALTPFALNALGLGDPVLTKAWERGDYRSVVAHTEEFLREGTDLPAGPLKAELAKAYYEADDPPKAFYTFLEALEEKPAAAQSANEPAEGNRLYEDAFSIYTAEYGHNAPESADEILEEFGEAARTHEDYTQLRLLVAIAAANKGNFPEFFTLFYPAFLAHPNHFLVHKTKGVICLKLIDQTHDELEKDILAGRAMECFQEALKIFKGDHALYRIILVLSPEEHLPRLVPGFIHEILANNAPVARTDVFLYVKLAVDTGHPDLAGQIIERASADYDFSRSLNAAKDYFEKHCPQPVAQNE